MAPTRRSTDHLLPLAAVMLAGAALWYAHALAWDLGGRSPILSHESAQVALAARELSWNGRFATPFAFPVELVRHASPPWPLAGVQPGLVLVEAFLFRVAPAHGVPIGSDPRAWLTLIVPFSSFLMLGAAGVLGTRHLLAWHAPDAPRWVRAGAPAAVGLTLVLDPEAQHLAVSGVPELPFTVLLLAAVLGVGLGAGARFPRVFGALLGVAGLFRGDMLVLAPLFVAASTVCSEPGRRLRVAFPMVAAFVLPLLPWWIHQWRALGAPGWDVARFALWDQVEGRTWLEFAHRAWEPDIPRGAEAWRLLALKVVGNLGRLLPELLEGARGLWLGSLVAWLATRPPRPLAAAGLVLLAALAIELVAASAGVPRMRTLFPVRLLAGPAGMLALWSLVGRVPGASARARSGLRFAVAVLALAWGLWLTQSMQARARVSSSERVVPASRSLTALSMALNEVLRPGETVMSNLGPSLAWQTNHPVLALAHSPADVPACRRRHEFRHVVLVLEDAGRAGPAWREIFERPGTAATVSELGARVERRFQTRDGFQVVWLELGALPAAVAARAPARGAGP
jgi:hypothetical protein